jgi:oxygen-independent coproporphyrinogen-3 oxidase
MIGLPKQTSGSWADDLEQIRRMQPNHVSIYMLELDEATKLGRDYYGGKIKLPEDEFITDSYSRAIDMLAAEGYEQYEISNFARPGYTSQHNLKYWLDAPYYGFGAGSHAYLNGHRYINERNLEKYIRLVEEQGSAVVEATEITPEMHIEEGLFLGLRKIRGITLSDFNQKYNTDVLALYKDAIQRMLDAELLEIKGDCLRLTRAGLALSNEVFQEFVTLSGNEWQRAKSEER